MQTFQSESCVWNISLLLTIKCGCCCSSFLTLTSIPWVSAALLCPLCILSLPVPEWVLIGYSGFLPQSKAMHLGDMIIGYSYV